MSELGFFAEMRREIGLFKWFIFAPFGIVIVAAIANYVMAGSLRSEETGPYLKDEKQLFRKNCVYHGIIHDTVVPAGEPAVLYEDANRATCPTHL